MNKNYGKFGIAIQADEEVDATEPGVSFYASDNSDGMHSEKMLQSLSMTKGPAPKIASYVDSIASTFGVTTLAFPDLVGALLAAACGKDDCQIDSNGITTHTITFGDGIPTLTVFEQKGADDADIETMTGAKIDTLTLTAEGNKPLQVESSIKGCSRKWLVGQNSWPADDPDLQQGFFALAGAQLLFALASDEPGKPPAGVTISKIQVTINNALEAKTPMGSAEPAKQAEQSPTVTVSIEGSTDSTDIYREVATGAKDGGPVSSAVITGSTQMVFPHTADADQKLIIKVPSIPWICSAMPVSPEGGEFDLNLSTDGALDAGDGVATFIVANKSAGYFDAQDEEE